ncbi:hypothetical protein NLM33_48285 (plasmid) [Bradyrhizobium sp. CCGUVB1N3]|uniref:hypothetical protein n=1 Tax=Bradyrhizobium sp. CCGUVB1N3 TaxID=2949629 RepID=UPI0020B31833|nr:hypothetical protein [Bradyrhizobium sp. CCGUVB1N3]MCP3477771.1 hypothetical protein [Bradyrhizobium sp. CCGUVB1N3]MCP3477883.1 hypothetical protein [Bradyrhizobium sp. CCGUVB1N3]
MRSVPFTRPTLIAAVELFEQHSQARFNQVVLRLGLENEISSNTSISVAKKCDLLGRIVVQRSETVIDTLDGRMTLGEAVVRQAALLAQQDATHPLQTAFARGLAHDAFVLVWDDDGRSASIRAALPGEIQLPETDDEVHRLLNPSVSQHRSVISIRRSKRTPAAIGRPATDSFARSSKAYSATLPEMSARKTRRNGPTPRTVGRCWRKSASCRRAATDGLRMGKATSMAYSRCCTLRDRIPVFRMKTTAPFVFMSYS